jgi:predicted outer membrane protein
MLRRIPRILRHAVVVVVLLAVSVSVYQSWASGAPGAAGGWTQTEFGPLGPADRNLLEAVRQANLWEGPTSQQAQQQATSAEVQEVGSKLADEHAQLDEQVRSVADQVGVLLPNGPSAKQLAWMDEIASQTGSDYDRVFIQRVREAHALVLPVIAEVRSSTQNDLVREFAETSAEFVTRHQGYLESTGLVDYTALPYRGPGLFGGGTDTTDLLVPILVFVATLLGAIALFWGLRNRAAPAGRRERVTIPQPSMHQATPRLPELTPVAAIPAPRGMTIDNTTIDDTGPIPVISNGTVSPAMDTGSQRWSAGVADSGRYNTYTTNGTRIPTTDSGSYRSATDTGSQRAVNDTGSHRAVSSSGSHRMPRSRARHSTRR